ncbi:hypothetical protein [Ectobacillus funiculus]|uniref:Uncharacterized protein n=1 Tax=Ectobacillus funiculus TaxID=137993 RepID=A0ABV5WLJ5_9BACI
MKIQLKYELLSEEFMELEVDHGVNDDAKYGQKRTQALEAGSC